MQIEQSRWTEAAGWSPQPPGSLAEAPQLILLFGSGRTLRNPALVEPLKSAYPTAHFLGCSTAGEICGTQVTDDSLVATAIHFEHTRIALPVTHRKG